MSKGYGGMDISDDDTEISDVDPDEMAKMIQDVDDLDSTLFGPTLEKRPAQNKRVPIKSVLHSSKDSIDKPKAHVSFVDNDVDFDDDLLEDLLSLDGNTSGGKTKSILSKKNSLQASKFEQGGDIMTANVTDAAVKATPISELFGINDGKTSVRESSDWLGLKPLDSPIKAVDSRVSPRKEFRTLTSEHHNTSEVPVGKSVPDKQLAETINWPTSPIVSETPFGTTSQGSLRNKSDIALSINTTDFDSRSKDGFSSRETRVAGSKASSLSVGAGPIPGRESRRQRNSLGGFVDPLGLFTTPPVQDDPTSGQTGGDRVQSFENASRASPLRSGMSQQRTPDSKALDETPVRDVALPSWLGGTGDASTSTREPGRFEASGRHPDADARSPWIGGTGDASGSPSKKVEIGSEPKPHVTTRDPNALAEDNLVRLVVGTSMEQQSAASLERQELQLTTALQLKHHEDRLAMILSRQQMTLQRQEDQLQTLVERQVERQEMIERQMKEQQNRINDHINTLTSQPGLPTLAPSNVETTNQNHQQVVALLETENNQLRASLETLRDKHAEEVAWVKESYRRQLEMLEASLQDQESRLKGECVKVTRDYETRLLRSEEEIKALHRENAEKVATLRADHATELQRLRAEQENAIRDFKKHQDFLLEHMNNSWKAERASVQANQDPTMLASILREVAQCKQAVAELHDRTQSLQHAGKTEAQLVEVQDALSRQRAAQEERARLQSLVTSLERDASRQRTQFDEDRHALRQEVARLERERASATECAERERRELQKLKEDALSSANEERTRIEETKLWLASEKSRLATLARLQDDGKKAADAERAEAASALRVAQEAARSADEDRERLLAERQAVSMEQRRLEHLRLNLGRKAQDLDNLTLLAVATKEEAHRALDLASQREREQTARALSLQRQTEALTERERKLSEEKMSMSQERVTLRTGSTQHQHNTWAVEDHTEKTVVDPRLVIMKLKANHDNSFGDLDSRYISSYFSISK